MNSASADIFSPNVLTENELIISPEAPIKDYNGYIAPGENESAAELGAKCADELKKNIIADFERSLAYCNKHDESNPDLMVHVSTFKIIGDYIYVTYYANTGTTAEDPKYQEARLAFCPLNDPTDLTVKTVQKVGDTLGGKKIDALYDTIMLYKGGDEIYILWTASADSQYYRFYCTFSIKKQSFSEIKPNKFTVGDITNDFSISGIKDALRANNLPSKKMFADIGIMQKLSTHVEHGKTVYYTGAYSGYFNCIIKSSDFINWEYVSSSDFINLSEWENAAYVINDKCYYFVRQHDCMQGFLTYYDLNKKTWEKPCLIRDAQSRSDFIYYNSGLYLIHAPIDRCGFGITKIDLDDLSKSRPIVVADMKESLFYPFADIYNDRLYMSYTVDRKHIRLSEFSARKYLI